MGNSKTNRTTLTYLTGGQFKTNRQQNYIESYVHVK